MTVETVPTSKISSRASQLGWLNKRIIGPAVSHLVMILVVLFILLPMLYAFLLSTQVPAQYYRLEFTPGSSFLDNMRFSWNQVNLGRLLLNTSFVAITVSFGKIFLSILGAFAFVYFSFRGKPLFFALIMLTHMLPLPVRIVPTFELIDSLGWTNSFQALTIPFFASATGILLFRQFYQTIPPSLVDAARMDGAGPLQFLVSIVMPISRSNMAALFLIEFIYTWNQYLWPLIIANSDRTRVIQVGLRQLVASDAAVEWHRVMAGVVMAAIPPLIVLILLQKSLTQGIALNEEK